jgi:LPXTG-motif cell wall-anchored protein
VKNKVGNAAMAALAAGGLLLFDAAALAAQPSTAASRAGLDEDSPCPHAQSVSEDEELEYSVEGHKADADDKVHHDVECPPKPKPEAPKPTMAPKPTVPKPPPPTTMAPKPTVHVTTTVPPTTAPKHVAKPAPPKKQLPVTGGPSAILSVVGAGLLAAGGGFLAMSRRRLGRPGR